MRLAGMMKTRLHRKNAGQKHMRFTRRTFLIVLLASWLGARLLLAALEHHHSEDENYSRIEDGLYMGGNSIELPPGTNAVLNLCEYKDLYECDIHVWDKIRDSAPAPDIAWLKQKADWIDEQQHAKNTTFVHCFQGASRSGLVVAAYMMRKYGWTRDEAITHIRAKRSQIRPNPAFMELLSEWERVLKE